MVRQAIAEPSFRSEQRERQVRSFRRGPEARSFRLYGAPRLRPSHR
jgi:hypothetical protein